MNNNVLPYSSSAYNTSLKPYDALYGPWESFEEFFETIFNINIDESDSIDVDEMMKIVHSGVTIGIKEGDTVVEYWNPKEGEGFVKKEIDIDSYDFATKSSLNSVENELAIVKSNVVLNGQRYASLSEDTYTKGEVQSMIGNQPFKTINGQSIRGNGDIEIDIDAYTKTESDEKYATKSEIPTDYLTSSDLEELNSKLDEFDLVTASSLNDLNDRIISLSDDTYTKDEVQSEIGNQQFKTINGESIKGAGDIEIDIDAYTKTESDEKYATKGEIPTDYLTSSDLNDYARKSELPTDYINSSALDNYATKDEIPTDYITSSDLNNYATKSEIPTDYLTSSDLEELSARLNEFDLVTASSLNDLKNKIDELSDDAYTKTESDEKYATKSEIPTDYLTSSDLNDYARSSEIPTDYLTSSDLNDYARKSELPTDYINSSALDNYATKDEIPTDYLTSSDLEELNSKLDEFDLVTATALNELNDRIDELERIINELRNE